ncbi:MAG: hypothetical protein P1P88_09710, partial [Bacteroidales bacterium]|nr:hypothetical protein [Bacteroidales bacterium]
LASNQLPFVIVFTKADKISKRMVAENLKNYFSEMEKTWEQLPLHFTTSAHTKLGRDELLGYINELNHSEVAEKIKSKII